MRQEITVIYSEEDQGYIATHPALPYCSAFGETEAEARGEFEVLRQGVMTTRRADLRHQPPQAAAG